MSFVLNKFSQIADIKPKPTTYIWHKRVNNLEMSSVPMISHEVRLLLQCFFANDIIIKNAIVKVRRKILK